MPLPALLAVALLALAATAGAQETEPFEPGKVIVKFKDSLTQCAHCLLAQGQSFASALTDGSPDLDVVNQTLGVTQGSVKVS